MGTVGTGTSLSNSLSWMDPLVSEEQIQRGIVRSGVSLDFLNISVFLGVFFFVD